MRDVGAPSPPTEVVVVDYGVNNVGSVVNMLRRLGLPSSVARSPSELATASALILPGIGSFDTGVQNLRDTGLFDAIRERVEQGGASILGICLGMQLLSRGSEEGRREGLGLVPAFTQRLAPTNGSTRLKIPHMGWTETDCLDDQMFGELGRTARFYYVHSFHVVCDDEHDVAARCTYGVPFTAALRRGRVLGTQFHPEKSHRYGLAVLAAYTRLVGAAHA